MGMMGMGGMGVLMSPAGQKELDLTADQIEKVETLSQSTRESMREKMGSLQDVPQEERQQKMMAVMRKVNESTQTELKKILKDEQLKRYHEINLQTMGVNAFSSPQVVEKLKLTDDQKEKVATIESDLREEMQGLRGQNQGDFQAAFQKMAEKRKDALTKVTALLTDDQKATWKEMTGKPFEMPAGGFGGRARAVVTTTTKSLSRKRLIREGPIREGEAPAEPAFPKWMARRELRPPPSRTASTAVHGRIAHSRGKRGLAPGPKSSLHYRGKASWAGCLSPFPGRHAGVNRGKVSRRLPRLKTSMTHQVRPQLPRHRSHPQRPGRALQEDTRPWVVFISLTRARSASRRIRRHRGKAATSRCAAGTSRRAKTRTRASAANQLDIPGGEGVLQDRGDNRVEGSGQAVDEDRGADDRVAVDDEPVAGHELVVRRRVAGADDRRRG